jgi:uncharacterized protein YggE
VRQGYIASNRVAVRLTDTARLGTLLAEAAARAEASVDGPRWEINPENPAHEDARHRAMADARRRADIYAHAEGLVPGHVLAVVEVGAEQAGYPMRMPPHGATLSGHSAIGYSPVVEMPVHFEGLEVVAGVQVTYSLVEG